MTAKKKPVDAETVAKVLELRRAGAGFDVIAERLELKDAAAVEQIVDDALKAAAPAYSVALEADRLDRMHMAVWPKAARGDLQAVDRAIRISERRERLLSEPKPNDHALRDAFDAAAETSSHVLPVDVALVEAGRTIADRVDEAVATGEGQEVTKALYLVPHMVNILREMLATPAARKAAGVDKLEAGIGKLGELRAIRPAREEKGRRGKSA